MDSERQIVACLLAATADLELPRVSDDQCRNIIGLGLREAIEALFPGRDARFHQQFVERYREHWFDSAGSSALFPGARETLEQLHDAGYLLAIATGKGRSGLDKVLAETDLVDYFHAARCSDETQSKPHPRMLLEILEQLAVAPEQAVMIGDTEYDMEMARQAGVAPIAVSYGVHHLERLLKYQPLACLQQIDELGDWVKTVQPPNQVITNG